MFNVWQNFTKSSHKWAKITFQHVSQCWWLTECWSPSSLTLFMLLAMFYLFYFYQRYEHVGVYYLTNHIINSTNASVDVLYSVLMLKGMVCLCMPQIKSVKEINIKHYLDDWILMTRLTPELSSRAWMILAHFIC